MNYKIKGAMRRNRKYFILFPIIWLILQIFAVAPFVLSNFAAKQQGIFDLGKFINVFTKGLSSPFSVFKALAKFNILGDFFSAMITSTIIYTIAVIIGIARSSPKNEYTDIEHGSSDWSQRGEQYEILNKNEGIILSEHNYLPVDKRGNVNVLVVGRFWFW